MRINRKPLRTRFIASLLAIAAQILVLTTNIARPPDVTWAQELCGSGFTAKSVLGVGLTPVTMVVKDLDGDSDLDIATANSSALSVSVLRNDGGRQFHRDTDYPIGVSVMGIDAGDIDGDGIVDLVVGCDEINKLAVLWGQPGDSLGGLTFVQVHQSPSEVKVDDLDGDGRPDITVLSSVPDSIEVFWGDGTRGFGDRSMLVGPHRPERLSLGDVDGDGRVDIVATSCGNDADSTVWVLKGLGGRSFAQATPALTVPGFRPCDVAIGRLDGDAINDIAIVGQDLSSLRTSIPMARGSGADTFALVSRPIAGQLSSGVVIRDVNLNGFADVVVSNWLSADITVFSGRGDGTVGPSTTIPVDDCTLGVSAADMDGDGRADILGLVSCSNSVAIVWNDLTSRIGAVAFTPSTHQVGSKGGILSATVHLPSPVSQAISSPDLALEWRGRVLGRALSVSAGEAQGIVATFDRRPLDGLDLGEQMLDVSGCDSAGFSFRASALVRVLPVRRASLWQDSPVGSVPIAIRIPGSIGHQVNLRLFDCAGRLVSTVRTIVPATGSITWDGRTNSGGLAPSGLYIAALPDDQRPRATGRVVLLR